MLYNGEKIAEWMGALAWAACSERFNVYVFSNARAPEKGGYSMAPALQDSIFARDFGYEGDIPGRAGELLSGGRYAALDGVLNFRCLERRESLAQYRGTIALVYRDDEQLNDHFRRLGAHRFEPPAGGGGAVSSRDGVVP